MNEQIKALTIPAGAGNNSAPVADLRRTIDEIVAAARVTDLHTHLFPPQFGALNLWGVDELLTYHYLISELFRFSDIAPADFWRLDRSSQADLIWQTLFVENTPLSEAARGVVCVMSALGLDPRAANLDEAREFFRAQNPADYLDKVLEIAGVGDVVMTNDPLDAQEIEIWESGAKFDARFHAALRIDRFLNGWNEAAAGIAAQGFDVDASLDARSVAEMRRFLDHWIGRMNPL